MIVNMYTDGACSGNPGPGGWAVVITEKDGYKKYSCGEIDTTNNRMELKAVLECLRIIENAEDSDTIFRVHSDSAYVVNAIKEGWLTNWNRNGWKTRDKGEVKNSDLWRRTYKSLQSISNSNKTVEIIKVRGHSGNTYNELCDKLAKKEVERLRSGGC